MYRHVLKLSLHWSVGQNTTYSQDEHSGVCRQRLSQGLILDACINCCQTVYIYGHVVLWSWSHSPLDHNLIILQAGISRNIQPPLTLLVASVCWCVRRGCPLMDTQQITLGNNYLTEQAGPFVQLIKAINRLILKIIDRSIDYGNNL